MRLHQTRQDETLVPHHPQGAIQEVLDRQSAVQASLTFGQPSSLDLQALLDSLVKKQEHVFEGMTHFLQLDKEWLVDVLEEANSRLGELGPFLTRGYLELQIQLHRLKVGEGLPWQLMW